MTWTGSCIHTMWIRASLVEGVERPLLRENSEQGADGKGEGEVGRTRSWGPLRAC